MTGHLVMFLQSSVLLILSGGGFDAEVRRKRMFQMYPSLCLISDTQDRKLSDLEKGCSSGLNPLKAPNFEGLKI